MNNTRGFSLIEVLIATVVFASFILAYVGTEGHYFSQSIHMKEEIFLTDLASRKLNEIVLNPPTLRKGLTLIPETKSFEDWGYPGYEYTVTYKELLLPEYDLLFGKGKGEEEESSNNQNDALRKTLWKNLQDNIQAVLWQLKISVKRKDTDFPVELTTLLRNDRAKVKIKIY